MSLTVSKCLSLSLTRARHPHVHLYAINGVALNALTTTKDLGVIFDRALSFTPHYFEIIDKARSLLGYVKRIPKDFDDLLALKNLYTAIVRPYPECVSPICCLYEQSHVHAREIIQHKFLRFIAYRINLPMAITDHDYSPILYRVGSRTQSSRRKFADLMFIFNVLSGFVDCPAGLSELVRRVHVNQTRNSELFVVPTYRTYYEHNSSVPRILRYAKEFDEISNIFGTPRSIFRSSILHARL